MTLHLLRVLPLASLILIGCGSKTQGPAASPPAQQTPATAAAAPTATVASTAPVASSTTTGAPSANLKNDPAPAACASCAALLGDIQKGIVKNSPTSFNLDRGTVGKILDNQPALMSESRIVPEVESGKVVGVRVFGARPDTLVGLLGIENGDRVEKINGVDMGTPEKAVGAFAGARTANHLTVLLNRAGQEMTIDYKIK